MSLTPKDISIYHIVRKCNTSMTAIQSGSMEMKDIAARNGTIKHLNSLDWPDQKIANYLKCSEDYVGRVLDYRPKKHLILEIAQHG